MTRADAELSGLVVDFIAALFNNEPKARTYLAHGDSTTIARIRQIVGTSCPPTTFSMVGVSAGEDHATAQAVLRYPDRMVRLEIYLARRDGRWVITGVAAAK